MTSLSLRGATARRTCGVVTYSDSYFHGVRAAGVASATTTSAGKIARLSVRADAALKASEMAAAPVHPLPATVAIPSTVNRPVSEAASSAAKAL